MSTGCGNLQGTLHTFLALHFCKVKIERVLMLVELTTGIDNGCFVIVVAVEEADDIGEIVHAIDLEIVDDSRLAGILLGYDETFELFFSCADGYWQGTVDGLQLSVEPQFTNHHVLR